MNRSLRRVAEQTGNEFPTCVGMNRLPMTMIGSCAFPTCVAIARQLRGPSHAWHESAVEWGFYISSLWSVPHMRGDEPHHVLDVTSSNSAFPTHVGNASWKRGDIQYVVRFIPTHVGNAPAGGIEFPPPPGRFIPTHAGTPPVQGPEGPAYRFIPTHVGNAADNPDSCHGETVDPHACGARIAQSVPLPLDCGSSPRMWGTLSTRAATRNCEGFIPTHVGNASPP